MKCSDVCSMFFQLLLFLFCDFLLLKIKASQHGATTDASRCCKGIGNTFPRSCESTTLTANEFQQSISTPLYPESFEPGIYCKWKIFGRPGRRILLDIRNLHLASKDDDACVVQQLKVTSPLTGLSMGPYCGHDGLPNIVTAGNYVVVELLSPQAVGSKNFKGFQIVYMESVQVTSEQLRPPDWSSGMYLEYRGSSSPLSPRIRYNSNRHLTTKKTRQGLPVRPTELIDQNLDGPNLPNRKPPKEKDRVLSNPNNLRILPPGYYIPRFKPPARESDEAGSDEMSTSAIAGIVCGGILMIVITTIVLMKIQKSRRRVKRDSENGGNQTKHNDAFNTLELSGISSHRPPSNNNVATISSDRHYFNSKHRVYSTPPNTQQHQKTGGDKSIRVRPNATTELKNQSSRNTRDKSSRARGRERHHTSQRTKRQTSVHHREKRASRSKIHGKRATSVDRVKRNRRQMHT